MRSFVENSVQTYFVSPPGFDAIQEVVHQSDDVVPMSNRLGLVEHLLSLFWYLLLFRPDRFVPFNILGGFVGGFASILTSTETVLFVRGDFYKGRAITGGLRARLIKRSITCVEWFTFRLVDHVVFISEHNRQKMLGRTGLDESEIKTTVLYNDTLTKRVTEQLNDGEKSLLGTPVIGFAGEFPSGGMKGVSDLIDAVALLSDSYPDLHLYLLGRGDGIEALRRRASHYGIADRVHLPGWVDDPIRYMQAFDIYILPSYHEGLGNSLLEALAAETPIAGSDVGGIPEVVYERDYLFKPGNPSAIANVIAKIFKSEDNYKRAMENCRKRQKAFDFDWSEAAKDVVIAGSSSRGPDRVPMVPLPERLGAPDVDP
jgi:glycosyltransferase involved in cell wall biosynthesis